MPLNEMVSRGYSRRTRRPKNRPSDICRENLKMPLFAFEIGKLEIGHLHTHLEIDPLIVLFFPLADDDPARPQYRCCSRNKYIAKRKDDLILGGVGCFA